MKPKFHYAVMEFGLNHAGKLSRLGTVFCKVRSRLNLHLRERAEIFDVVVDSSGDWSEHRPCKVVKNEFEETPTNDLSESESSSHLATRHLVMRSASNLDRVVVELHARSWSVTEQFVSRSTALWDKTTFYYFRRTKCHVHILSH